MVKNGAQSVFLVLFITIFLLGCANSAKQTIESSQIPQIRSSTARTCQNLVGTSDFSGIVSFEECDVNCLGGCPGNGPEYCYYGVVGENDCVVYVKSRIKKYPRLLEFSKEQVFNDLSFGKEITIKNTIKEHFSYECLGFDKITPSCTYFIVDEKLE